MNYTIIENLYLFQKKFEEKLRIIISLIKYVKLKEIHIFRIW